MLACYKCDYRLPDRDGEAYCQCGAKMFQCEPWAIDPQRRLQMIADGMGCQVWAAKDEFGPMHVWFGEEPRPVAKLPSDGVNWVGVWDGEGTPVETGWASGHWDNWKESLLYAEPGGSE